MSTDDARRAEFVSFCHEQAHRLVGFVIRLGASPADADDVVQEVLLALFASWDSVRDPRGWTRSVAIRTYLKSTPSAHHEIPTDAPPEQPTLISPEAHAEIVEAAKDITALLSTLPFQQRMVLAWSIDGFSHEEIARALRTTPGAVRTALRRARGTLKKIMVKPQEVRS
ncbi:RNA polymerase sigma factor [Amycolatopsis sp. NPDC059021]|uniref:RNA polymerase sigma factor n=1 Tax=Amycolatopsis sp. NPDC059021 TaxID=3346704 RepID=UPI00366DAE6B